MASLNWATFVLLLNVQGHKLLDFTDEREGVIVWSIKHITQYLSCTKNHCRVGWGTTKILLNSALLGVT